MTVQPKTVLPEEAITDMAGRASEAAAFLKTLAHEGRLMILCHLSSGEKSVGELEALLDLRQASVSQMLARLRDEGHVATRREGKAIFYRLADETTARIIGHLHAEFCGRDG